MNAPNDWLRFAEEDLRMAELAHAEKIYNQVCFHSQQCAEKAMKAVISDEGKVPPRAHRLVTLSALISSLDFSHLLDGLRLLDSVYLPTRYPDTFPGTLEEGLPNAGQAAEAHETARKVFDSAKIRLVKTNK